MHLLKYKLEDIDIALKSVIWVQWSSIKTHAHKGYLCKLKKKRAGRVAQALRAPATVRSWVHTQFYKKKKKKINENVQHTSELCTWKWLKWAKELPAWLKW
jgi:hypothetical protein